MFKLVTRLPFIKSRSKPGDWYVTASFDIWQPSSKIKDEFPTYTTEETAVFPLAYFKYDHH